MFALKLSDNLESVLSQNPICWQIEVDEQLNSEGQDSLWARSVEALGKNGISLFVKLALQLLNVEAAAFCLKSGSKLVVCAQEGFSDEIDFAQSGPDEVTITANAPTAILNPIWPNLPQGRFKAYLGVPINLNGTIAGVLSIASNDSSLLSKGSVTILENIGQIISLTASLQSRVLESAASIEDAHQQIRDLTAYANILQDKHLSLQQKEEELGRLNVRLQDLADTDGLTGLLNHRACYEILQDRFQNGAPTGLILIDLDNFKSYNDEFGHVEGDSLLREISNVVTKTAGKDHLVCRYGGEELAVIVKSDNEQVALDLADQIRQNVSALSLKTRKVTFSAGIATLKPSVKSVEDLVRRADQALYAGKRSGKNRVLLWTGNSLS